MSVISFIDLASIHLSSYKMDIRSFAIVFRYAKQEFSQYFRDSIG